MKLEELFCLIAKRQGPQLDQGSDFESYLKTFALAHHKSPTLQQTLQLSAVEIEALYCEAFSLYKENQYEEAFKYFQWLVILSPFLEKHWMGLAACQQMRKEYEKALHSYAVSALLNEANPLPHWYAALCYLALNDKEEARRALKTAHERVCEEERYKNLKRKIESKMRTYGT
jgi:type III secretion system low calcium response chaperone LcrH/SycD